MDSDVEAAANGGSAKWALRARSISDGCDTNAKDVSALFGRCNDNIHTLVVRLGDVPERLHDIGARGIVVLAVGALDGCIGKEKINISDGIRTKTAAGSIVTEIVHAPRISIIAYSAEVQRRGHAAEAIGTRA